MKLFILWLLAMLLLIVFTLPNERPDKLDNPQFGISESAQLYFNNVRSYYYNGAEEGDGMFRVYRIKSAGGSDALCGLSFSIYENWRSNEAFIRVDSTRFPTGNWSAIIFEKPDETKSIIPAPEVYNESQLLFARDLYRQLCREYTNVHMLHAKDTCTLSAETVKAWRRTLSDYFKLTGAL